ncbi:putative Ig domain-containing protein [Rhizobium sp. SYY.PMSO]|uniref:putative Ig domain-containing protein n=1 Tax=Rhizobium sp. SYY.PMSO TaxID=3382192 RepID=UPI003990133F
MRLLPVALAALVLSSSAHASEIIWRSPKTGILKFVEPPPELEIPDPVIDFWVSDGATTKVRSGTSLAITPIWPAGSPRTGYTFSSPDLPSTLSLDLSNGLIKGRISIAGRYDFSVTISDRQGDSQTVPVGVLVE